jgi:DNA-binding transcriptional LysR family regulator
MDLNALALFAKVVQANSFSEAARQLNMPLATVSRRVAELEDALGICLLKRTTRRLRLTEIGSEVLEHAQRTAELREAISGVVSRHQSDVSGTLRLSVPPNLDSLLLPLVCAFQSSYPQVRVQIRVTTRTLDNLEDDVDMAFALGAPENSLLVARRLLTYRHRLVASPAYLAGTATAPEAPQDLLRHRLIAFSPAAAGQKCVWEFSSTEGRGSETLTFWPHLSMNDFAALTTPLLAAAGIGELPPMIQPELVQEGKLIEVMPGWQFRPVELSLFHARARHMPRAVRLFKEFAIELVSPASSGLLM